DDDARLLEVGDRCFGGMRFDDARGAKGSGIGGGLCDLGLPAATLAWREGARQDEDHGWLRGALGRLADSDDRALQRRLLGADLAALDAYRPHRPECRQP